MELTFCGGVTLRQKTKKKKQISKATVLKLVWVNLVKVTDWPKEDAGKFFGGDSYIILNTYKDKESDEVSYVMSSNQRQG